MRTLDGKFVWIWNVRRCESGDMAAIARRCREHGVGGVLLKSDDGGVWFDQGRPWADIAGDLRAHGLVVAGWGYHYLDDWQAEADRAVETILSGVCDAYVSDLEAESEGKAAECEAFFRRIRDAVGEGFPIGYSPLPVIDYHQRLPYVQANADCDFVVPQFYCRALSLAHDGRLLRRSDGRMLWAVDRVWEQWERWSAIWQADGRRVPPILPAFDAFLPENAEDLPAYDASLAEHGSPGCSFWSYEHMTDELWRAVGAFRSRQSAVESRQSAVGEPGAIDHSPESEAGSSRPEPTTPDPGLPTLDFRPPTADRRLPTADFHAFGRTWEEAAGNLKGVADEANRRRRLDREDAERAIAAVEAALDALREIVRRNGDTR